MSKTVTIDELISYLQNQLCGKGLVEELYEIMRTGNTTASKESREEVFNREFLSPAIADFFFTHVRRELSLSDAEIGKGLGTEGSGNCSRFGFSPSSISNHIFTKDQVLKSIPPEDWFFEKDRDVRPLRSYPDFALREPLPLSVVGEHKAYWGTSKKEAVKNVFEAAKQVVFYQGALGVNYKDGMIVVTDLSQADIVNEALKDVRPEILSRFGEQTRIHLCVLPV